ncbi:DUF58 domain-containing protein [Bacillus tianshenii]|uniref:DUF58 domain-containing protein n=1 Tax=Sutcliffiella tianshenii TaxID=1463404 RepID=UPI001CD3ECCB|nr:DUF58 domain-containing protein [Bacillus tianshenii]MCA1319425.1 DUF58 domain-containing protein [Bacillus tianshenii]
MTRSSKNLWGRFLFRDKGIVPTSRLLLVFVILSGILVTATFWDMPWSFVLLSNILVLLFSLVDLIYSPHKKQLKVKRSCPAEMERGINYEVALTIENRSPYDVQFSIIDGLPQSFNRPFPLSGSANKETSETLVYQTKAPVRGDYQVNSLYMRYRSTLGLWEKQMTIPLNEKIKVIPDMTQTKNFLEDAQRFLNYEGIKIRKYKSGVGEFSKIRSYVVGDDPRKINWRQTAKLQEVMTNEYEPEHGKHITILIDCGRMMGAELKSGNRLEKSIEAALTVTAAALQKGDYVAVLAFSKKVKVYIPPAKGMAHLQTILQAIYNIEVDAAESNYGEILNYLQLVQKKRSLILLFSDIQTFLHEESALVYLKRLRQRHLFLMIGIEDEMLVKRGRETPVNAQQTMVKSIAQQQILIKKEGKAKWEKQGLLMVEAREEKLATTAVSYYIDMINRGLL